MVVPLLTKFCFYIMFSTCLVIFIIILSSTSKKIALRPITYWEESKPVADSTENVKAATAEPEKIITVQEYLNGYVSYNRLQDADDESAYFQICPHFGDGITIVFVITSSPSHDKARNIIRRSWGSVAARKDIAVAFIIGATDGQEINDKIKTEQHTYGDLIRGKFLDTYDNLTLKTTWMLQWMNQYCPKAVYAFKTDDDVFVNVDLLLEFIEEKKIKPGRQIYGRIAEKWHPVRDKNNKYYISRAQFAPDVFPDFATGPAYMFSNKLSAELYSAALNLTYMKLEDVFYNGIVAEKVNISRTHIPEFTNNILQLNDCALKNKITIHDLNSERLSYAWYKLNSKC